MHFLISAFKMLTILTFLAVVACSPFSLIGGPQDAARQAFTKWADNTGTPYKDPTFEVLSNDGVFASVRIRVLLRQTADATWLEHEATVQCRNVGGVWQTNEWMAFALTAAEKKRIADKQRQEEIQRKELTEGGRNLPQIGRYLVGKSLTKDGNSFVLESIDVQPDETMKLNVVWNSVNIFLVQCDGPTIRTEKGTTYLPICGMGGTFDGGGSIRGQVSGWYLFPVIRNKALTFELDWGYFGTIRDLRLTQPTK